MGERYGEDACITPDHTASKWLSRIPNPGLTACAEGMFDYFLEKVNIASRITENWPVFLCPLGSAA